MTTPAKVTLHTYSEETAFYFAKGGARAKVLYVVDDIPCFEVKLKGRPLKRLLETPEAKELLSKAIQQLMGVGLRRLSGLLYTVSINGQFATMEDQRGLQYVSVARNPKAITDVMPINPEDAQRQLVTDEEKLAFLNDALANHIPHVRFMVGYVDGQPLPYYETYPTSFLRDSLVKPVDPVNDIKGPDDTAHSTNTN